MLIRCRYLIAGRVHLTPADFKTFAQPYLLQIADAVKDDAPVILFPKGTWYALEDLSKAVQQALVLTGAYSRNLQGS